jgi:glucose-6-phosphate dehydrogenase assembly protein OpcA
VTNLGAPVAVDAATIEAELTALWKTASDSEAERAVIRACSCNLVVIARDEREAEALPPVLLEISKWHPSRSIIAFRDDAGGGAAARKDPIRAWISAQCAVPFAGAPEVCCEAIAVAARGSALDNLPDTVVSLLIPDLPLFVYWRSFASEDRPIVERLTAFAELLIVDSHRSKDDPAARERLLGLLTKAPGRGAVRDLNWSRLTAWRDLIAQFFDARPNRRYLRQITEVEISRNVAAPGNIPTRTLLLTGWLASRLGWHLVSTSRPGDDWLSRWESEQGEVAVRFTGVPSESEKSSGISSLRLTTRDGAAFSVVHDRGSACMTAQAAVDGSSWLHSVPVEPLDEETLLIRELSLTGEDPSFRAALTEALALETSFRRT